MVKVTNVDLLFKCLTFNKASYITTDVPINKNFYRSQHLSSPRTYTTTPTVKTISPVLFLLKQVSAQGTGNYKGVINKCLSLIALL
jgi:hypothetical protein